MKALKKATALLLSLIMVFSMMSVMANATIDDGNRNSFKITSWFLRYDEETDEWVKTDKAARGDKVKVQLTIQTDFGVGAANLLWAFSKKNLTFDTSSYTAINTTTYYDIHNETPGTLTGDYGYYGNVSPITNEYKTGNNYVDRMVTNNLITEDFLKEYGVMIHGIKTFTNGSSGTICQKLPGTDWMYEYIFTVADDATGKGELFAEPKTFCSPSSKYGYFSIYRAVEDGVSTIAKAQTMGLWQSSYDVTGMESITFDNTVNFTTDLEGATIEGTTEYTGYIGEAFSKIEGFEIPTASADGKNFLGWSLDGSTVISEDDLKAMTVAYEPVTLKAVFQAAEATYALNVYEMDTNGAYPEKATITYPGASTGAKIEYVEKMPADEDKVEGVTYVEYAKTGFSYDSEKTNTLTTTVIADGDDKTDDGDDIVIYLKRAKTNIAFNAEDGTAVDAEDRYYESTYTAPAAPEKKGYTCTEWAGSDGSTLAVGKEATVGLTAVTYTPVYKAAANTATIVFNYVDQVTGEEATKTQTVNTTTGYTVAIVETMPENPAENTTYVLYSALEGIDKNYKFDAANASNDLTATVAADGSTELNLQYIPVQYTATFTGVENGTFTDDYYTEITVPAGPGVAGQDFTGWLGSDGKTVQPGDKIRLTADVTYTAQYADSIYTITYVFDGAPESVKAPDAKTDAKKGTTVTLSNDYSADGYTFTGWTVTEGTGASYDEATGVLTVGTSNVTVTGNWIKNTYTINYYLDDAKKVLYASQPYSFGDAVKAPETPTTETEPALEAGTKFDKWLEDSTAALLPAEIDAATAATFTETADGQYSIDYVAAIADIEYVIKVYYNGLNKELTGYDNNTVVDTFTAFYGDVITEGTLPDPSDIEGDAYVEGYTLTGWNPTLPHTVTADQEFRARFTVNEYPVTFDANGGYWMVDSGDGITANVTQKEVMVAYGAVISAPIEHPVREGYTQDTEMPWDPELTDDDKLIDIADIPTFKARWNPNPYTIKFTVKGATADEDVTTETTQPYDEDIKAPETDPTKAGYKFVGWSTDGATVLEDLGVVKGNAEFIAVFEPDANGVNYTVKRYFMNLDGNYDGVEPEVFTLSEVAGTKVTYSAKVEGFTLDPDAEGSHLTETIKGDGTSVINAYFSRNKITVDVNDDKDEYYYDEEIPKPADPEEKPGYEHTGWEDEDKEPVDFPYNVPDEEDKEIIITPVYTPLPYDAKFIIKAEDFNSTYHTESVTFDQPIPTPDDPAAEDLPDGYAFVGWAATEGATEALDSLGNMDTVGGETFYAVLEGIENGSTYKVEKYFMTVDGKGYEIDSTKTDVLNGTATKEVSYAGETFTGFTFNADAEGSNLKAVVMGNGSTVLKAYYDREQYDVTVDNAAAGKVYYGATYTTPETSTTTKTGYALTGWTDGTTTYGVKADIANVAGPIVLTAVNTPNANTAYKVVVYQQQLDKTYTPVFTDDTLTGETDTNASYDIGSYVIAEGFKLNTEKTTGYDADSNTANATITGDGLAVIEVYVDRETYTVSFNDEDGVVESFTALYEETINAPAYTAESGYTFKGWKAASNGATVQAGDEITVKAGETYTAVIEANDGVAYTVKLYMMNTDGETYKIETENYTGKTGTEITYEPGTKTGFTFDEKHANNKLTDTITADGTMTLRVYYSRNTYTVTIDNESDTYYYDEVIEDYTEPSKDGYHFDGWYSNGALVTFPYTVPASNVSITSKLTPNNYRVVFMVNETEYAKDELAYESVISAPATPPEVAGFTFLGWSLTDKQTTEDAKVEFTAEGPKVEIEGNTYYAILAPKSNIKYTIYKVFEKLEGGWGEKIPDERFGTAGDLVTINADDEAETGFDIDEITPASDNIAGDGSTEFYIYYVRKTVKVTINGESDDYLYEEPIEEPAKPEKDGYTFTGWEDSEGNTIEFPITAPEKDLVIVPTWDAKSFSLSFTVEGEVVEGYPTTVEVDSKITAPADPKKEGWTFTGWYDANGKQFTGTMPAYDVVYAAEFVAGNHVKYTIRIYTMDTNGEYTNVNSTVAYGTTGANMTIVPETETMVGYTVDTTKSYLSGPIEADGSTVYTVYYARNSYDVTFDGSKPEKVYFGAAIETPADPVKDGYTFTGWKDAEGNDVPATMPAKNLDFTSQWTKADYTVTYVVNGVQTEETYAYGATVTIPTPDEVTGMTFSCWSDGDKTYQPGETFEMPANDMIIVAQFTVAIYTVTFLDADGMTFATELVKFGETIPVPAEKPTKANYTFEGWNLGYTTMPAKNITVEPIFKRIPPVLVAKEGSTTVIDTENMIIYGLEEFLDESLLRSTYLKVIGDGYFTVTPVEDDCYGTGTKVELYDNLDTSAPIETYTIIIFGDLNGDAVVQAIDSTYVNDEALGLTNWHKEVVYDDDFNATPNANYDVYMTIAADVNRDGVVDSIDATIIADASIGIEVLDQLGTPSIV